MEKDYSDVKDIDWIRCRAFWLVTQIVELRSQLDQIIEEIDKWKPRKENE